MVNWSLHPIKDSDDEGGPLYALLPDDLADGLLIGEHADIQAIADRLNRFLETGIADEPIDEYDPQLVPWISAREAEENWGIPRATITWACRQGHIAGAEKLGNRWRFPQGRFLAWMHTRKGHDED